MLLAEYLEVLRRQSLNCLSFGASATCFGVSGSLIRQGRQDPNYYNQRIFFNDVTIAVEGRTRKLLRVGAQGGTPRTIRQRRSCGAGAPAVHHPDKMGEEGLEPSRHFCHRILSPACIPIPPLAHFIGTCIPACPVLSRSIKYFLK